jgi:CO dehydrogenase nickel-insertion accessory protein CooC1
MAGWHVLQAFLKAQAEEARYNVHACIRSDKQVQAAAFESGKELTLLYVTDKSIDDLIQYLDDGVPVTENVRPEEE